MYAYRIEVGGGSREAVSILEPRWVADHGLAVEVVLGFINPAVSVDSADQLRPTDFKENPAFLRLLSRVIYENADDDPVLQLEADVQGAGWVHLIDGRAPEPAGRVAPEDIIGTVKVEAGKVVRGSFQHSARHRLLTSHGLFRLSPSLDAALDGRLRSSQKYHWRPADGRRF